MPLPRMYFDVLLEDPESKDETELRVEVRGADQLRSELEAKRIPRVESRDAMHTTYLWCWSAAVREGKFTGNFREWMTSVVQVKPDKGATTPVDPTDQAASDDSA